MGIPTHRRPFHEHSPTHLPGSILKIHEPSPLTPKTDTGMKPHVKFWIAAFIAGIGYFFYYTFPTLPENTRQIIVGVMLFVLGVWEILLMVYRGDDDDVYDLENWEPSKESIFSYDNGQHWLLGCSVLYLTVYGIRRFNKFIDSISLFKL